MKALALFFLLAALPSLSLAELWDGLPPPEVRHLSASFSRDPSTGQRILKLRADPNREGPAWVSLFQPAVGWKLGTAQNIQASVKNSGSLPAEVTLWAVASRGWAATGRGTLLQPGQTALLSANLRETYPDSTPKIDPNRVGEIRIMVQKGAASLSLEVSDLAATGTLAPFSPPPERLEVPDMTQEKPAAGLRVRYPFPSVPGQAIYAALYLPSDWVPGKRYPVVAEFPGNLYYSAKNCWSTGRPEQCVMGYGITSGSGSIWVSLPFVDLTENKIAESGFGSGEGDDTVQLTREMIADLCRNWGGDESNLFLCGFSRGSIACGYIGLRNDEIASLWKGFIACQHYDGFHWQQSRMEDAVARARRFQGKAIFQVDNSRETYRPVMEATSPEVTWTWTDSGLGYHAAAMFLDDRPSSRQVRHWYLDLVK